MKTIFRELPQQTSITFVAPDYVGHYPNHHLIPEVAEWINETMPTAVVTESAGCAVTFIFASESDYAYFKMRWRDVFDEMMK